MQPLIDAGEDFDTVAQKTYDEIVAVSPHSGNTFGAAVKFICDFWVHGDKLGKWYDSK